MRKNMKTALGVALAAAMLITPVLANANVIDGSQSGQDQATQTQNAGEPDQNQNANDATKQGQTGQDATQQKNDAQLAKPQSQQDQTQNKAKSPVQAPAAQAATPATQTKAAPTVGPQDENSCKGYGINGATSGTFIGGGWKLVSGQDEQGAPTCTMVIAPEAPYNAVFLPQDFVNANNLRGVITDIDFAGRSVLPADCSGLFEGIPNLKHLHDTQNVDASHVTKMYEMFEDSYFTDLDLSNWDVHNVRDIGHVFYYCQDLKSLNISGWNLASLPDGNLSWVLAINYNAAGPDLSLNLSNVSMPNQTSLASNNSPFNSGQLVNLKSLNMNGFNAPKVTDVSGMLSGINSLETLDMSHVSFPEVTNISNMLKGLGGLKTINMSYANFPKVTDLSRAFSSNTLESFDLNHASFPAVTGMSGTFSGLSGLKTLDASHIVIGSVNNMQGTFAGLSNLTKLNINGLDTSHVTNMNGMFSGNQSLETLDVSSLNTSNVTNMGWMFEDNENLRALNVSNFDTSNVTNMDHMFEDIYGLTTLDVSNFDTRQVKTAKNMFYGCNQLVSIKLGPKFTMQNATEISVMFTGCQELRSVDLSGFDTHNMGSNGTQRFFAGDGNIERVDISSFTTNANTSMAEMFELTPELKQLAIGPQTQFPDPTGPSLDETGMGNPSGEAPYTGKWIKIYQPGAKLSASDLAKTYSTRELERATVRDAHKSAGTYVWQQTRTLGFKPGTGLPSGTHTSGEDPKTATLKGGAAYDVHVGNELKDISTLTYEAPSNPYQLLNADGSKAKGYEFDKWTTNPDGTGNAYQPKDTVNLASGDVTLYAQWKAIPKPTVKPQPSASATAATAATAANATNGNQGSNHNSNSGSATAANGNQGSNHNSNSGSATAANGNQGSNHNSNSGSATGKPANGNKEPSSNKGSDNNSKPATKPSKKPSSNSQGNKAPTVIMTLSAAAPVAPAAQQAASLAPSAPAAQSAPVARRAGLLRTFGLAIATPQLPAPTAKSNGNKDQTLGGNAPKANGDKKSQKNCGEPVAYFEGSVSPVAYTCNAEREPVSTAAQENTLKPIPVWPFLLLFVAVAAAAYGIMRKHDELQAQHREN